MDTAVCMIGDRMQVGQIPTSFINFTRLFPGLATINGPLCVGAIGSDVPLANAMFAPGFTPQTSVSLASIGITNIFGQFNVAALSNFTGVTNKFGSTFKFALSVKNGADVKQAINLGNGASVFNGLLTANGGINTNIIKSNVGIFSAKLIGPVKHFKIPHPSKPGYSLYHSCLEGPENSVYYRGHLSNSNKIILPDYWDNLIDKETITVHLMPHKSYQELYVKSIEWGKYIHIVNNNGGPIECDYLVLAERKDIEKLKVEVEDKA